MNAGTPADSTLPGDPGEPTANTRAKPDVHTLINRTRTLEQHPQLDGIRVAPIKARRLDVRWGNDSSCAGNSAGGLRASRAKTVDHHVVSQDVIGGKGSIYRANGIGHTIDDRRYRKPTHETTGRNNA